MQTKHTMIRAAIDTGNAAMVTLVAKFGASINTPYEDVRRCLRLLLCVCGGCCGGTSFELPVPLPLPL